MATVHDVASYIMRKVGLTTTMKLQKLVYYAQAWSLALRGTPLFAEPIAAWTMGPVAEPLHEKHRGMRNVVSWPYGDPDKIVSSDRVVIDFAIQIYGHETPERLSDMTHQEDPWLEARRGLADDERGRREISHKTMARYYGDKKIAVIGRAYQQGRLSLGGVSEILAMSRADAVELLEKHEFNRSVDVIRMSDEQRKAADAKLRADRLRRAGRGDSSTSLVNRSVVATQRIEGVDARPWLKH